jgi:hypothetical protein
MERGCNGLGRCGSAPVSWFARCWMRRRSIRDAAADLEVPTMAELTEKKRDSLKKSQFGLPDEKKYPMPDKSHAANAKARASQQKKKGTITASEKATIDRKADRILDK